jgi:hypothetical protein
VWVLPGVCNWPKRELSLKQKTRRLARFCWVTGGEGVFRIQTQQHPAKPILSMKNIDFI